MGYCTKCGCEITDGAAFCTNCGTQIKIKKTKKINLLTVSNKILFIISASLLMGITFHPLIDTLFIRLGLDEEYLIIIAVAVAVSGIAFLFSMIFYKKGKIFNEKHQNNILLIIWSFLVSYEIFALLLKFIPTEFGFELQLSDFFMRSDYIDGVLNILFVSLTLLICSVNNSKSVTIISTVLLMIFYLRNAFSMEEFKLYYLLDLLLANYDPSSHSKASAIYAIILLFAPLAILIIGYICKLFFKEKTANTVIIALTAVIALLILFDLIQYITSGESVLHAHIFELIYLIPIGLYLLSLKPEEFSIDNLVEDKKQKMKKAVKTSILGLSSFVLLAVILCVVSGLISAYQIKSSLEFCTAELSYPDSLSYTDLENMQDILRKTHEYKMTPAFISKRDLDSYRNIDENIYTIQSIAQCFNYVENGSKLTEDLAIEYKFLKYDVNDDWKNDSILKIYYEEYVKMLPSANKIEVTWRYDSYRDELTFKVENNNPVPIENCDIKFEFDFTYIDKYYDIEKYKGTETYTVEDIDGLDSKEQTVEIDPEIYYDSYWSYNYSYINNIKYDIISVE